METDANITAAMFAAYLICCTKAYLMVHGEKPQIPSSRRCVTGSLPLTRPLLVNAYLRDQPYRSISRG